MIRYSTFPRTVPPPVWASEFIQVFEMHEQLISTESLDKGLTSNGVLSLLATDLRTLGFNVESGKTKAGIIERPVYFGENGEATVRYQVDGYHPEWRCSLEIEAGRAWMGNAVYRDLVLALVMVDVEWLCLAVPISYRYRSGGRDIVSRDYENTRAMVDAVYGHSRVRMPYRLFLVGY